MESPTPTHLVRFVYTQSHFHQDQIFGKKGYNDRHGLASPLAMSMGRATLGLFQGGRLKKANLGRRRSEHVTRLRLTFFRWSFVHEF